MLRDIYGLRLIVAKLTDKFLIARLNDYFKKFIEDKCKRFMVGKNT